MNRFLAESVLGWEQGPDDIWFNKGVASSWSTWNPLGELRDCEPLLDKIEKDGWEWDLDNFDGRYTFELMKNCEAGPNENSLVSHANGTTRTEALCLAIARAYGYKEE